MGFVEIFIVAVGLSMDAFAVSVCKGLCMKRVRWLYALVIALFFGVFQALMPVIGWALGSAFASLIEPIDHWVAFILLAFIGGKMIWDGLHEDDGVDCEAEPSRIDLKELLMLAIATSIDALAVGISFAFLGVNIAVAACIIGITTFALSIVGVWIGHAFGSRFEHGATIIGGIVLVLIGLKILLEHLGVLSF